MNYLIENFGIASGWLLGALSVFLRYAVLAGTFFLVFYVWKKSAFLKRKIQQKFPNSGQVFSEIRHSAMAALIFAVAGIGIYFMRKAGWTQIYLDFDEYSWAWLPLSFFLLTVIHDTYFYWMHRLIHRPGFFEIFHKVHHQSHNPTPWAALSFHPLESVLEIAFLPVVVLLIPFHPLVIFFFTIWSLLFNVLGHLGFEMFGSGFTKHPLTRWLNTATHHNMHHQRSNCNYGLYYNFWDTVMKTNHKNYHEVFEQIQR